jgi:hypothetical protein
MMDPRLAQLQSDIAEHAPDWCATKWVMEPYPHLFSGFEPETYWAWKTLLAERIGVDPKDVLVTGSGAVGFSINPRKGWKAFDDASDLDVAVISTYHFDVAWRTLREIGSRRLTLTSRQKYHYREHKTRLIYWGTIATDWILPLLPFGKEWTAALEYMATVEPTKGREVKARVYRDYSSLRAYLLTSFEALREQSLAGDPGGTEPIGESP